LRLTLVTNLVRGQVAVIAAPGSRPAALAAPIKVKSEVALTLVPNQSSNQQIHFSRNALDNSRQFFLKMFGSHGRAYAGIDTWWKNDAGA
jgi:hypothetical protein